MPASGVVHIIDDDDAVRESLAFLFKSAGIEAHVYENPVAFLDVLPTSGRHCIVTDVRMPGMSGIELLKRIRDLRNPTPVIVITGHGDVALAVEAMKAGASDFLEKPFEDDLLLDAVNAAFAERTLDADHELHRVKTEERLAKLTQRERQVLDGLVTGHANKVIAYDLGISPRTVEIYRANLMTKMEAQSLSDLVRMALAVGALKPFA